MHFSRPYSVHWLHEGDNRKKKENRKALNSQPTTTAHCHLFSIIMSLLSLLYKFVRVCHWFLLFCVRWTKLFPASRLGATGNRHSDGEERHNHNSRVRNARTRHVVIAFSQYYLNRLWLLWLLLLVQRMMGVGCLCTTHTHTHRTREHTKHSKCYLNESTTNTYMPFVMGWHRSGDKSTMAAFIQVNVKTSAATISC